MLSNANYAALVEYEFESYQAVYWLSHPEKAHFEVDVVKIAVAGKLKAFDETKAVKFVVVAASAVEVFVGAFDVVSAGGSVVVVFAEFAVGVFVDEFAVVVVAVESVADVEFVAVAVQRPFAD